VLEVPQSRTEPPREETSPAEIAIGALFLLLILPTIAISLGELSDLADSLEYGGEVSDMRNSLIYSVTTVSILLVLGLYYLGAIKSRRSKLASGWSLVSLSLLNILCRLQDFREEIRTNQSFGWEFSGFEYLSWPSTHERIELVFLGAVIGLLIMKK
tara:strand:- start:2892 stop:3362 length:471 start_codon:yes stop_codon:yes gene_type:complete